MGAFSGRRTQKVHLHMTESDLSKDRILDWIFHLFRPVSFINFLRERDYQRRSLDLLYKFWLPPIIVSLAINSIIFYSIGIDVESRKPLVILGIVFGAFELLAECMILYLLLRMMSDSIQAGETLVCFTIIVIFSPILTLFAAPNTYYRASLLREISAQHFGLAASIKYFLANAPNLQATISNRIYFPGQYLLERISAGLNRDSLAGLNS
jgi:hypothetical protein